MAIYVSMVTYPIPEANLWDEVQQERVVVADELNPEREVGRLPRDALDPVDEGVRQQARLYRPFGF